MKQKLQIPSVNICPALEYYKASTQRQAGDNGGVSADQTRFHLLEKKIV